MLKKYFGYNGLSILLISPVSFYFFNVASRTLSVTYTALAFLLDSAGLDLRTYKLQSHGSQPSCASSAATVLTHEHLQNHKFKPSQRKEMDTWHHCATILQYVGTDLTSYQFVFFSYLSPPTVQFFPLQSSVHF